MKDVLLLQSMNKLNIVAGSHGLHNYVTSVGIADYEFCKDVDYPKEGAFEKSSLVLSSLLFAKDEPSLILPAIKSLHEAGVSGLAYKTVIFKELPQEVIDFSNEVNFPILKFGTDTYFENIIVDVMEAIRLDDTNILTEANITKMIEGEFTKSQIATISRGLSLEFKEYSMGVFIKDDKETFAGNIDRWYRNFYLNRSLNKKAILTRYMGGFFLILTSKSEKREGFELIIDQVMEYLGIDKKDVNVARSQVKSQALLLDLCFRESYHTYIASLCDKKKYEAYQQIGTYQFLIPMRRGQEILDYSNRIMGKISEDVLDTIVQLVVNRGDIVQTADDMGCHQNTIRYRVGKAKDALGYEELTDQSFYALIEPAVRLYILNQIS